MIVVPFVGRKGDVVCEVDGILCLFDRHCLQPGAGDELDVMICACLRLNNMGFIPALIVRPVTHDDFLIEHSGFQTVGSMCRTTAHVAPESDATLRAMCGRSLGWITPGRTPVRETQRAPIPGKAYVSASDILEGQQRITGVPSLDEICPSVSLRLTRRRAKITV